MAIAWNEDRPEDRALIEQNLADTLQEIVQKAQQRDSPVATMAQEWHRRIYKGVSLPLWYFAGEIRDDDPNYPELIGYEVAVGGTMGVPSARVPAELSRFEKSMNSAVGTLDTLIPVGVQPDDRGQLNSVLTLCAYSHGEWVRIHPFANGNGRTARLWANWCALRYGLPPFVRLKPRPSEEGYARASALSMRGDHAAMILVLTNMLDRRLQGRT